MKVSDYLRQASHFAVGDKLKVEMTRMSLYSSSTSSMKDVTKVLTVKDAGNDYLLLQDDKGQIYRSDSLNLVTLHGRNKAGRPFRYEVNKFVKV